MLCLMQGRMGGLNGRKLSLLPTVEGRAKVTHIFAVSNANASSGSGSAYLYYTKWKCKAHIWLSIYSLLQMQIQSSEGSNSGTVQNVNVKVESIGRYHSLLPKMGTWWKGCKEVDGWLQWKGELSQFSLFPANLSLTNRSLTNGNSCCTKLEFVNGKSKRMLLFSDI